MQLPFQIDLTGQVAVVTGGSGVIGGIFARALGKCGAKVAVLGRKVENGIPVVKDIEAEGGEAVFVAANVLEKESLKAAKQEILDIGWHLQQKKFMQFSFPYGIMTTGTVKGR